MLEVQAKHQRESTPAPPSTQCVGVGRAEAAWTNIFRYNFSDPSSETPAFVAMPELSADRMAAAKNEWVVDDELKRYEEEVVEDDYWQAKKSVIHYWSVSNASIAT
jgi:hypothetical protein